MTTTTIDIDPFDDVTLDEPIVTTKTTITQRDRRNTLGKLLVAGMPLSDAISIVVKQYDVTRATVTSDFKAISNQWQRDHVELRPVKAYQLDQQCSLVFRTAMRDGKLNVAVRVLKLQAQMYGLDRDAEVYRDDISVPDDEDVMVLDTVAIEHAAQRLLDKAGRLRRAKLRGVVKGEQSDHMPRASRLHDAAAGTTAKTTRSTTSPRATGME